jgi:hypothetical protein
MTTNTVLRRKDSSADQRAQSARRAKTRTANKAARRSRKAGRK